MSARPKRNGEAQAALGRRAPKMKHRNEPRGGQRNEQSDLLEEIEAEYGPDELDIFIAGWLAALRFIETSGDIADVEKAYREWKKL
jgi:hypothetical protein